MIPTVDRSRRPLASSTAGLIALLALFATFLGGCASGAWGEPYTRTRMLTLPHVTGGALSIETHNGAVEALGTERDDVSIEVVLHSPDLERLEHARVQARREPDGLLRVWVAWPDDEQLSDEGASISVNLPDAEDLTIRSRNGGITVAGLGGKADLVTSNGSIIVDTFDGSVFARTTNGNLFADKVSGEIEMYSTNGRVNISDAFGPIRVETSNGGAVLSTMHGNAGPIRVRTTNGPITLNLGEGFEGVLKCDTTNGRVTIRELGDARLIESSDRRVEIRVGESDEISALRTSNGSIRVQRR